MPTLLTHIVVNANAIPRWEEIMRVLVRRTHGEEPSVIRYEYWRGAEAGRYYALLAYPTAGDFYAHQGSEYHDEYLDDFATMFAEMRLEWVDPVQDGGSPLPPTEDDPLPAETSTKIADQRALYPILIAQWWAAARAVQTDR